MRLSVICMFSLFSPTVIEEIFQEQISERRKPHLNASPTVFHIKGGNSHYFLTFLELLQPRSHLSVYILNFLSKTEFKIHIGNLLPQPATSPDTLTPGQRD